ncbi:MAG: hypothetical protein U5M53_03020 [Rhodoferax sp.]|nr:hypothetical protein [Rhodoferax sp.]
MQINRLTHLIFPPATPGASATSADALQPDAGAGQSASARQSAPSRSPAVAPVTPPVSPASNPSVKLDLERSAKATHTGTYTREGVVAKPRANSGSDTSPAEQFVASAVNTLRDFEMGKVSFPGIAVQGAPNDGAQAAATNRFGGLRQAVSRLNVFA